MAPVVSKLTRNRGVAAAGRAAVPWPPPVLAGTVAGPLPDPVVTGPFLAARADEVLLCLPAAGRLRARAGEPLVLDRAPGATDADVRCLVEGPGVTAAWLLAGAVALRGAAVVVDGGAVVLTGAPGLGASTLAAGLALRGHDVLADRVVDIDPEALLVCPRDAALQLDPPTVTALRNGDAAGSEADPDADPGARPGDDPVTAILAGEGEIVRPGIRRRRYALRPAAGPAPLRAVVILERRPGPDIVVEPLTGLAAVRGLQDRAWHPRLVGALGGRAAAFGLAAAVAAAAPVVVLAADRHPRTRPPLAELARRIEALAAG